MRYLQRLKNQSLNFIAICFCCSTGAIARDVVDSTNARIQLVEEPSRIVTLAPSLGELASDFAGSRLSRIVGVSEFSDYPPGLKKKPSIGPYHLFNIEKIVALKPDLVLATSDGNAKDEVLHLRELGLPVVVVRTETFEQIEESMRLVSKAMGNAAFGESMAKRFNEGLSRIRAHSDGLSQKFGKKRILLQLGDDPLVVVGSQSFLNVALTLLGGENIYSDSKVHYPRPSLEDVLHRNPDGIGVMPLDEKLGKFAEYASRWKRFSTLKAVQLNQVRVSEGSEILRPTLRLLEGLSRLEKAIYGTY